MKNVFAIASVLSENIQHTINKLNHCKYIQFFFCSSFETGRIIPEVCCITKPAIKNVHFCTELSKVAALVATFTCLFSCCNSSSVETTAGNSVTKMMIESCLSTQRVAQIGFSLLRRSRAWNFSFNIALKYRYALCSTRQKNAYVRYSCHRQGRP